MQRLALTSTVALFSTQALAHGDHGTGFGELLAHLVSDAFHLWPLALGAGMALVLGAILQQRSR
jgi:hypothetical protein